MKFSPNIGNEIIGSVKMSPHFLRPWSRKSPYVSSPWFWGPCPSWVLQRPRSPALDSAIAQRLCQRKSPQHLCQSPQPSALPAPQSDTLPAQKPGALRILWLYNRQGEVVFVYMVFNKRLYLFPANCPDNIRCPHGVVVSKIASCHIVAYIVKPV